MLIVQKYGGSSLETAEKIRSAAKRIADLFRQGNRMVVVVSARGDTTDRLLADAEEVSAAPSQRELDACLSAGEQVSAALMAMAVEAEGVPAVSLGAWQVELMTDCTHGDAQILGIRGNRIWQELDRGQVVIVTGFQGLSLNGNLTTLGRGGSDTTAVALAGLLEADLCQIYTDVDGIYDRDPRKYPDAVRYSHISYEKMLELIQQGAQVLHKKSVELARNGKITIEVRSAQTDAPGTLVNPD